MGLLHTAADAMLSPEIGAHRRARAYRQEVLHSGDRGLHSVFDTGLASARQKGWRTYEAPCGHDVMLDMPEWLVEILQEVA